MQKQRLIALLLVSVMVASTLTAIAATTATPVAAATATQTTLSVSKTTPIINDPVTFTVTLKKWNAATKSYVPLANKYVTVVHTFKGVTFTDVTLKTNANGIFPFVQKFGSTGPRYYYATFTGDSSYAKSMSVITAVTVQKIPTKITLYSTSHWVAKGGTYTILGHLFLSNGELLASKPIYIYWGFPGGLWSYPLKPNAYTDKNGYYTYVVKNADMTLAYEAVFRGDASYVNSASSVVTVVVYIVIH